MNQMQQQNPLLGVFDRDPGRWRPFKYGVDIDVPVGLNGVGIGEIETLNQPFIMDRITCAVVGDVTDPVTTGLADDGQYYLEWEEQQSRYQNAPLLVRSAYGSDHYPIPLSLPIAFAGNRTFKFRVTNAYARTLNPDAETFRVHVTMHGLADWGPDTPPSSVR